MPRPLPTIQHIDTFHQKKTNALHNLSIHDVIHKLLLKIQNNELDEVEITRDVISFIMDPDVFSLFFYLISGIKFIFHFLYKYYLN